jgi:hypothetical protein
MPLRRSPRILSAVLVASFAIAVSDGLLCLIPCAGMSASAVDGRTGADPEGHCATEGAAHQSSESLADPSSACAGNHVIGAWIGERVTPRASIESQPAEAAETMWHPSTSATGAAMVGRPTTSSSPPGAFIPLRI